MNHKSDCLRRIELLLTQYIKSGNKLACHLSVDNFLENHLSENYLDRVNTMQHEHKSALPTQTFDKFSENLGVISREQGGRFQQYITTDYCWGLKQNFSRLRTLKEVIKEAIC